MKEQPSIYQKALIWSFAYERDKFQTWSKKLEILLIILVEYFISEYLEHDIEFVYDVKHELVEMINETNSTVTKFKYFAD